jgi:hypothetical protein
MTRRNLFTLGAALAVMLGIRRRAATSSGDSHPTPSTPPAKTARRRGLVIGATIAVVVGLGAGSVFAYFTAVGSGSGVASTGTAQDVTVIAATGGAPSSSLYPGKTGADLVVELNNPNSYAVTIVGITQNGAAVPVGASGTCTTTGVTVPTQSGLSVSVASGTNVVVHISNGASMSSSSDSGCQGAAFQIPVTLTVVK